MLRPHVAALINSLVISCHVANGSCRELFEAVEDGDLQRVERLVEGLLCDVNVKDEYDNTPLHVAAWYGHLGIVTFLLQRGADVNARNVDDSTSLHLAVRAGHLEIAKHLLYHGADVNARDAFGLTPLHVAADRGDLEAAELLITLGADAGVEDKYGRTAADILLSKDLAEVFKKHKEKAMWKWWGYPRHDACFDLFYAVAVGDLEKVKEMVEVYGCDVDAEYIFGWTPLHLAVSSGNAELAKYLIKKGASINRKDYYGQSPLHLASSEGNIELMRLLIENGANVDAVDKGGRTPIYLAVASCKPDAVKLLIEKGALIMVENDEGDTPLDIAEKNGCEEVARILRDVIRQIYMYIRARPSQREQTY